MDRQRKKRVVNKPYCCNSCGRAFESLVELENHKKARMMAHTCPICRNSYPSHYLLTCHMAIHTGKIIIAMIISFKLLIQCFTAGKTPRDF